MAFDAQLPGCIGEILGEEPPPAGGDPLLFAKQWLAERNLGLVPVAEPASFERPGSWLARVRAGGEEHAAVLYGSPSGALSDPGGALAAGGTIVEGWVLAPLDLHLPIRRPYGASEGSGTVAGLLLAAAAEAPLRQVEHAVALAGRGLEGDRYATGAGTFGGGGRGYELTLVESEALADVGLSWEDARRNVVTTGISLNGLVGRRFRIGDVECVGRRLAEPCAHLERLTRPGIIRPLVHRAGLRADILAGGELRVGDEVVLLD